MATALYRAGPTLLTASEATIETVPGATTFIVRNIHVANVSNADATFNLSIGNMAAGTYLEYQRPVSANREFDWSGFLVVTTAELIRGLASATNSLTIVISGTRET